MRRLSLWMRAHPMAGDGLLAVLLAFADVYAGVYGAATSQLELAASLPAGLAFAVGLLFRREYPIPSACCTLAGMALHVAFDHTVAAVIIAPAISLYTLVMYADRKIAASYALCCVLVPLLLWHSFHTQVPGASVLLIIAWLLGEWVGARRAYHLEVERRLRLLESEQDRQARLAVAEERNRIAREIHDVLAHSVSVMVTQADGATFALRTKPDLAEQAMRTIGTTGRSALTELRALLGAMRDPGAPNSTAPQPTASGLGELCDRIADLGLPVNVHLSGDLDALPTGIGLSVYRIVQEALTNVLKHGDRRTGATVRVDSDGDRVRVEVVNDVAATTPTLVSGGNGLIGMRERASIYNGELRAGIDEGRWRVYADLPLRRGTATERPI